MLWHTKQKMMHIQKTKIFTVHPRPKMDANVFRWSPILGHLLEQSLDCPQCPSFTDDDDNQDAIWNKRRMVAKNVHQYGNHTIDYFYKKLAESGKIHL